MSRAIDRVRAAEAARGAVDVQYRTCPECGEEQGRIRGKDGSFKRWSKCRCAPRPKTPVQDVPAPQVERLEKRSSK